MNQSQVLPMQGDRVHMKERPATDAIQRIDVIKVAAPHASTVHHAKEIVPEYITADPEITIDQHGAILTKQKPPPSRFASTHNPSPIQRHKATFSELIKEKVSTSLQEHVPRKIQLLDKERDATFGNVLMYKMFFRLSCTD